MCNHVTLVGSHRVIVAVCVAFALLWMAINENQKVNYWPAHRCFAQLPFPYPFLIYSLLTYQCSGFNICNVCQTDLKRVWRLYLCTLPLVNFFLFFILISRITSTCIAAIQQTHYNLSPSFQPLKQLFPIFFSVFIKIVVFDSGIILQW